MTPSIIKSIDTILIKLILSLKIKIPVNDIIVIPAAPHIAYATLTGIFFNDIDKKIKHNPYVKNVPSDGSNFVNPSEIFIQVVPKVSRIIAEIK